MKSKGKFRLAPDGNPSGCRLHTLTWGLVVGILSIATIVAQEPSGKPDAPTPKTSQTAITLPTKLAEIPIAAKSVPELDTLPDLGTLATRFLEYASVRGCPKKDCNIVVTNFVLPDGNTSQYGMQLADELSKELASRRNNFQVIDRSLLQDSLAKDRIPAKSMNAGVLRSIAFALKARFVVVGTTTKTNDDVVQLSAEVFDVADKDWAGYSAVASLVAPISNDDLSPSEPYPPLPPITATSSGEKVYRAGVDGVSMPHCIYMPNPPYSEEARKFKVNGTVLFDAVINPVGRLENTRITRGLPDGLSETTIATAQTWRCNPALKDGKAVPTLVHFEIGFRLY